MNGRRGSLNLWGGGLTGAIWGKGPFDSLKGVVDIRVLVGEKSNTANNVGTVPESK